MKRRERLTSYDRFLLATLVVGILLLFVRYRTLSESPLTNDGEKALVDYRLQVDSFPRAETLALAEDLSFSDTKERLGHIESAPEILPAHREEIRADGTIAYLASNSLYELRGSFVSEGSFTENGFFANGRRHLTANQTISVLMNGLNVTILVLNIHHFSSK